MRKSLPILTIFFIGLVGFCYYQVLHMHPHKNVLSATTIQNSSIKQFVGKYFSFNYYKDSRLHLTAKGVTFLGDHTIAIIQVSEINGDSTLEDFSEVKMRIMDNNYNSMYKKINNSMCLLFINNISPEESLFCIQENKVVSVVVKGQTMEEISKDFDLVVESIRL